MENLLSNKPFHDSVPERFIFPPENRPGIETCPTIALPVIDLRGGLRCHVDGQDHLVREILHAAEEFGFFQVINHGISEELMKDMMDVTENIFNMSTEDKTEVYSDDQSKKNRLFSGSMYAKEGPKFWRDCLRLACYPLEENIQDWPQKPSNLREVAAKFTEEAREMLMTLLNLISQGLGLKKGYFDGDVSGGEMPLHANYYPSCPNPDLTLGVPPHCDNNVITLLFSGTVKGLQIKYQGRWIAVEPLPNAFAINIGQQLQIISNGLLKSVEHRAVTNAVAARTSIALFLTPTMDCCIAPAEELTNEKNPPVFKSFVFKDFNGISSKKEDTIEAFKIKA